MTIPITLTVENIDADVVEFILSCTDDPDKLTTIDWTRCESEPVGPDFDLSVTTTRSEDGVWNVDHIHKGDKILTPTSDIKDQFTNALLELSFQRQTEVADGFEHEHRLDTPTVSKLDRDPYDPKLIRVDTKPFSIHQVFQMINSSEPELDLSPDFQREFVWLDITRKSRLIESLLLRIPLPVFYLSQDDEGKFKVVDGVQRLTVIRDFLSNKFRLKNLEYLKECEGKWFKNPSRAPKDSLDSVYVRRIEQTQLFFNIIDPQTPDKVKYDIFRRINTGGKSLNAQEIRNCLENPTTRQFIKKLAKSEEFLSATRRSISSTRMADNEIVLRFIAFYLFDHNLYGQKPYRGDMDAYLNGTIEILNKLRQNHFVLIETAFKKAMVNAKLLFGDRAFRKSSYINKALFLSWSRILCDIDTDFVNKKDLETKARSLLETEIQNNTEYSRALSMATNDVRNVDLSYKIASRLLNEVIKDE